MVTTADSSKRAAAVAYSVAALVGLVLGLQALSPEFIAGTGGKWIRPENDYNAYLVAWHYYVVDAWRIPLFSVPAMSYPEGGSVLFNDALPIAALITKLLYRLTGQAINPFGWWILLTYALQGLIAARVMRSVGVQSVVACTAAAALATVSTSFVARMHHTALSTHFLLLWSIAIYFSTVRQRRAAPAEATFLLALTLLVNAYLFVMVFAVLAVAFATLWWRDELDSRALRLAAVGVVSVAMLGLVAGYGIVVTRPAAMKSEGFGLYSWNLATLLVPPDGVAGAFAGLTRDATQGQYEGEAYIGRGALLLLALVLLTSPVRVLASVKRNWTLVLLLVTFAVYAASNRVYAGGTLLLAYDLPGALIALGNYFRATGRFIWPLAYTLTILPLACVFRWWRPAPAVVMAVLAAWLQVSEALPGIRYRRELTTQAYQDLIDEPGMRAWMARHERVWQYPSWDCGGLVANRRWPSPDSNRELQLQLLAARTGLPTNSVYMSRALKQCAVEEAWGANPTLEPGTLYVLGPSTVADTPSLSQLAASSACTTLEWAVVCSAETAVIGDSRQRELRESSPPRSLAARP